MEQGYCTHCGRSRKDLISCIHQEKVPRIIIYIVLFLLQLLPILLMGHLTFNFKNIDLSYIYYGNIALAVMMVLMYTYQIISKKSLIAIFFGCHQKKDRSFNKHHFHIALCARCTGILLGVFLSLVLTFFKMSPLIYLILSIPLILDGMIQKWMHIKSTQTRRFVTGILFAPCLVLFYASYHYIILYIAAQLTNLL